MKRSWTVVVMITLASAAAASASEPDREGCQDHPLISRMPGFYISNCKTTGFDSYAMRGAAGKEQKVEGRLTYVQYSLQEGGPNPSRLQIHRNYENALKRIGGTLEFNDEEGSEYLRLVRDGRETWVHVSAYITHQYDVYILEKGAMTQDVTADAAALSNDIRQSGHAAVYGIYFDTGKAVVKPESQSALAEIAKLLARDAALKLNVVGHTDNVGTLEANMTLSQARAEAVVQALTAKHGVVLARLKGYGVGPLAPVASNDSEEGKAKNRRVELVKQ